MTESDGNSETNIAFRKKLYGWEESLHDEKGKLQHHRKFLRNYLIQLESWFHSDAKSGTGASGVMQITGNIFKDFRKRPEAYIWYIQSIWFVPEVHGILPLGIRDAFSQLIDNSKATKEQLNIIGHFFSTKEWKNLLRSHKYLNAYFGSVYLAHMHDVVNEDSMPGEFDLYKKLAGKIDYLNINTLLKKRILTIDPDPTKSVKIPELTPATYAIFLKTLQDNPELARSIFAARRYNGSERTRGYGSYGKSIREKDMYFIAIWYATTMAMLSSPQYRRGYCGSVLTTPDIITSPINHWVTPGSPITTPSKTVEVTRPISAPASTTKVSGIQKISLGDLPMGDGTIMVSEMKKNIFKKWNSEVIGKNFDNLTESWGIASLTKIMTAYVVYDLCREKKIDPKTHIIMVQPKHAWNTPWKSLKKPSKWTIEEAVDALVMKSQNTIAEALASAIVPRDEFMKRMNTAAKELGMKNTIFYTPSWLSTRSSPREVRTSDNQSNTSTEMDLQFLINHTLSSPYPIWSPTQHVSQDFSSSQIRWNTLWSADKIFLAALAHKYPDWEIVWTKTWYTKDSGKSVITIVKHKKTNRIFSIIGLNMTKKSGKPWDTERRITRFRIIWKIDGMIKGQ